MTIPLTQPCAKISKRYREGRRYRSRSTRVSDMHDLDSADGYAAIHGRARD